MNDLTTENQDFFSDKLLAIGNPEQPLKIVRLLNVLLYYVMKINDNFKDISAPIFSIFDDFSKFYFRST